MYRVKSVLEELPKLSGEYLVAIEVADNNGGTKQDWDFAKYTIYTEDWDEWEFYKYKNYKNNIKITHWIPKTDLIIPDYNQKEIYLDNAATTKPKKEVTNIIVKCLTENWGNPSSLHTKGVEAKSVVTESRKVVADFLGAKPSEIIFTSGACEANTFAILGRQFGLLSKFITTPIEHKSIIDCLNYEGAMGETITINGDGMVNLFELDNTLRQKLCRNSLVSIQYANNEIGTIQNIKEISEVVHQNNCFLHTDATQIIPERRINVDGIDMLSFSGQKIGAPKGIGVLYVREGLRLSPLIKGTQENGRRGGTENVPYIAGLAEAIKTLKYPNGGLRDYFVSRILSEIDNCYLVGCPIGENRLKNNASICFKGIEGEALLMMLDQKNIYASAGSACNSSSKSMSHVLSSIGLKEDAQSVVRFTFGEHTKQEIDFVIDEIKNNVEILRKIFIDVSK